MDQRTEYLRPDEIERRSFEIITAELGSRALAPGTEAVVKRVIHTTADFDYVDNLCFSENAIALGVAALKEGVTIVTDTNMARAGVNKAAAAALGCEVVCYMSDPEVALLAKQRGTTRAAAAVDRACALGGEVIFAVGNAPTALMRLQERMAAGDIRPRLIIGVPVGFVNVVESKEKIMQTDVPYIVARGRKGGSNVAAAICNALLYQATGRTL